ncbi:MAG TPA: LPS export ABC transporter periplasmic protein LptC [Gemmatimonadales bacterium]|jgi:LPS export ABC transporter protein LptC
MNALRVRSFLSAVSALSALSAFVALGCSDDAKPTAAATPADTADQVIFGLVHNITLEGVPRAQLMADTAYFYQGPQTADMRRVHVIFYNAEGGVASNLTSVSGHYEWRTGNMRATDSVVAITPDGRKLRTSILDYQRGSNQISGPNAFIFDAPNRHLEGESFTADPEFKNVVATKPRKGTLGNVELRH